MAGIVYRWQSQGHGMSLPHPTYPPPALDGNILKGYTKAWPTTWGEQFHIPIKRNFEFSGLKGVTFLYFEHPLPARPVLACCPEVRRVSLENSLYYEAIHWNVQKCDDAIYRNVMKCLEM